MIDNLPALANPRIPPKETDKEILRSLPPSISSALRAEYEDRGDGYGYDGKFTGYRFVGEIPEVDLKTARELVAVFMLPAEADDVDVLLTELRVATKSRVTAVPDLALMYKIFGDLCAEYPADVVQDAIRWWARNEVFWPALAELKVEFDRRVERRNALLQALAAYQPH